MNHLHKRRLIYIMFLGVSVALATGLILYAFKTNINAFMTPTQLMEAKAHHQLTASFYLGGLVKKDSLKRDEAGLGVQFIVTDFHNDITVRYVGVLPDLFREGKGMIAEGSLTPQGLFIAKTVLAKHDENYTTRT